MADNAALDRATEFLDGDDAPASDNTATPERLAEVGKLGEAVIAQIHTIFDPEIPVDIYELGLIYRIDIDDANKVIIKMTLTSPHCPVAEILPEQVAEKARAVNGITDADVEVVWDPPWHPSMMSEEAQLELGMIY